MTSNELIYKSIHIITEYYNNNLQPFFDNLSKDVLWIGPAERQEIRGRDEIVSIFSAEVHELTFTIGSIRATCISPSKTTHEVILQYEIYTHYPNGTTDLHNQRIHYSWYKKSVQAEDSSDYRWEIAVLHISNAWPYDSRDTIYPVHYKSLSLPISRKHIPIFCSASTQVFSSILTVSAKSNASSSPCQTVQGFPFPKRNIPSSNTEY